MKSILNAFIIICHFFQYMIRVSQYFDQITKLFQHDDSKSFQIIIPYKRGTVSTTFEQQNSLISPYSDTSFNDIHAEIESSYKFDKGEFVTKAYSDEPCKITFITPKLFAPLKTVASLVISENYPISFKMSYSKPIRKYTFKQNAQIFFTLNKMNTSDNSNNLSNNINPNLNLMNTNLNNGFELHTSSQLFNDLISFRFEAHHGPNVLLFESFWKRFFTIGTSLAYNWHKKRLFNAEVVAGASMYDTDFGVSALLIEHAIRFLAVHNINTKNFRSGKNLKNEKKNTKNNNQNNNNSNKNNNKKNQTDMKIGTMIGIENIGFETDKIASIAASKKLQENSKIKICLSSNKSLTSAFKLRYQDFLKMSFTGELTWAHEDGVKSHFGANIVFDLTNRTPKK
ncbi:hypothetical protein TRFO_28480 [Tritrichomonas foetus]|uniref:Uncharacterized protein n=1 Tax=Tritrichomonas foetus TaxID=1144522 RepID=A0A1J4JYI7_9EUKA|nr:hypothetical protein TRFO_28480 [Tritrichomonas foetus]|eukprot:OHT04051.1 hypothetical protein TRFO_28480 [Tritrichomonas foetus]